MAVVAPFMAVGLRVRSWSASALALLGVLRLVRSRLVLRFVGASRLGKHGLGGGAVVRGTSHDESSLVHV